MPATIVKKYAKFSAKVLGSIEMMPTNPNAITMNINARLFFVHLISLFLFTSSISLGFSPASPNKCLNFTY